MLPQIDEASNRSATSSDLPLPQKGGKGKQKDISSSIPSVGGVSSAPDQTVQQAWWLDVASPTWEDMRAIGKVGSTSILILSMLISSGLAIASSSSDSRGYLAAGTSGEAGTFPEIGILFSRHSRHRIQ